MCRIWIVIKVYTGKQKVNTPAFKHFCLSTYQHILNNFHNEQAKWISVPPTLHSLLGHAWELISFNDDQGLGEFTESGLENNNKFLRFYRRNLARKVDQSRNLTDYLTRLWIRSDPCIRESAPKQSCSRCSEIGHPTVSCPMKTKPVLSSNTIDEHFLSLLLK